MYIDAPTNPGRLYVNDNACKVATVVGEWVDYKFAIGDVNLSGNSRITPNSISGDWTIYIDEIFAAGATKATGNEVVPIRCEYDIIAFTSYGSTVTYVDEFQGATGVIKVDVESWGGFEFKAQQDASVFADYTYIVFKVWANVLHRSFWMNNATQPFVSTNIRTTNTWVYFLVKVSEIDLSQKNLFTYDTVNGSLYIDEVYASNTIPFINDGIIEEFTTESATSTFTNATNVEYLDEYEGKSGVAKVTVDTVSNQNIFKFKSTNITKEEIMVADWDYIEITFYISVGKWLFVNDVDLAKHSGTGWCTLQVTKEKLIENTSLNTLANRLTYDGIDIVMIYADSTPVTEIYFDSIKLCKNA